jgi:branched-chain amino acid transport system ATP-binding protein
VLEVRNLYVNYGKLQILHDLNFQVKEKDFVSIIGSNGAGKSTLLNTICGRITPVSGKIIFRGRELNGIKTHQIVQEGIYQVAENRKLFRGMTVIENLLTAGSTPRAKTKIRESLEKVFDLFPKLHDARNQIVKTLSGGEQQMVAVGCGIMACPELLMLDEPSLGIAPVLRQQIFKSIEDLNKFGITILLLEQNVKKSLEISKYAYVMERGQVALQGKSIELLKDPHVKECYLGL